MRSPPGLVRISFGVRQAKKCMQLSAIAYNLKFTEKRVKSGVGMLGLFLKLKTALMEAYKSLLRNLVSANLQTV